MNKEEDIKEIPTGQKVKIGIYIIQEGEDEGTLKISPSQDIYVSYHNRALRRVREIIKAEGAERYNIDHLPDKDRDSSISLKRGNRRLDFVYYIGGRLHEAEVKTSKDLGTQQSARQITYFATHCKNFELWIPSNELINAREILQLLQIEHTTTLRTY